MLELLEKSARPGEVRPEGGQRLATVAVVGLGYVGLPLAVQFGKHGPTVGYDLSAAELKGARFLRVTQDAAGLEQAEFVIVAVPNG